MTEKPEYLSQEALDELTQELQYLKTTKRHEVANRIEKAKDLGDLRENAEYHDAKEELAWLEGRIIEIEDKINRAVLIETGNKESVGVGSTIKVAYNDKEKTFTITGSHEADPLSGKISNESPIGKAFIGKKVSEKAEVEVPAGIITYTILAIE